MQLTSTAAVIDALGGNRAVAELTEGTPSAVSNWRRFKTFPARFHIIMQGALHEKGHTAPSSLWGMK
jgi:hypothetical protein